MERLPVSQIRQYASTNKKGTNVLGMVEAAEKLGFTAKGVKKGKTVIIISYRLSTVMKADKIIEEGEHEKLIAKRSAYYSLWEKQFPMLYEI